MKRLHLAIGVESIEASVEDYTKRFGAEPVLLIEGTYALFRTETVNVSIRKVAESEQGVRHLGWESAEYNEFTEETDCNGITWEYFPKEAQAQEIVELWPNAKKNNPYLNGLTS